MQRPLTQAPVTNFLLFVTQMTQQCVISISLHSKNTAQGEDNYKQPEEKKVLHKWKQLTVFNQIMSI